MSINSTETVVDHVFKENVNRFSQAYRWCVRKKKQKKKKTLSEAKAHLSKNGRTIFLQTKGNKKGTRKIHYLKEYLIKKQEVGMSDAGPDWKLTKTSLGYKNLSYP